jgi:proteasome lid subunit RPN8/RPN11
MPNPLLLRALGLPAQGHESPQPPPDPQALIAKTQEQAIQAVDEIVSGLSADVRQADASFLVWYWEQLLYHFNVAQTAALADELAGGGRVSPAADDAPVVPQYFISSRFLTECARFLLSDPSGYEHLHLVSGVQPGANRYTLEYMDKVAMAEQSETGARADQPSFTRALIHLMEWGQALHGLFHSHPGQGPGCTRPSPTDVATHQRLEQGDYPLIGAIFVPGYVRFFSTTRPFTVTIHGRGVTPVPGETHV